jgi:O-antigen/teichoic acid export membrane protein
VLSHKLFSNTAYAVFDQLIAKVGTTLVFIVLVRVLPEDNIATVGIATSYLVLVGYLDVGAIRILLRDYTRVVASPELRSLHFSGYLVFWLGQLAATLVVATVLQLFVLNRLHILGLAWVFWALTIDFVALVLQDWIKVVFYADLQQRLVTALSLALTVAKLVALALVALWPKLMTFVWLLIGAAMVQSAFWVTVFLRKFRFRPQFNAEVFRILKRGVGNYAVWDHLGRQVIGTLFSIDVAILSLLGQTRDIASYSIALRLTSLMTLVPRQIATGLQVALSAYSDAGIRVRSISSHLKANFVLSVCQWLFIVATARWLIILLFGHQIDIEHVLQFTILIATAVTVLGVGIPLVAVINNSADMRKAFVSAYLPALVLGLIGYVVAGSRYGALGMAYANILAYGGLVVALALFTYRNCPFPFQGQLVTPEEVRFLKRLMKGS